MTIRQIISMFEQLNIFTGGVCLWKTNNRSSKGTKRSRLFPASFGTGAGKEDRD
jgi:hypothetical protein